MPPEQKTKLEDIIQYTAREYYSPEDIALVRATFNGPTGEKLLQLIRKVMLPTISDPALPVEQLGMDMFMGQVNFAQMPADEAKAAAMGLQLGVKAVMGGIMQLKQIANVKEESEQEKAARLAANSSK